MRLTGLDLLFWAAGLAAHLLLLSVLLVRRRFRVFPIFTAFIISNIGRTAALLFVRLYGTKTGYFYTYWSLTALDVVLQLSVVYEMYSLTFRPLGRWAHDLRGAFVWLVAVSIALAAGLTWLATPDAHLWMQVVVIKGSFFSAACMSELFVGMLVLAVRSGLPWKTHVARISQGFGAYSVIDVLIEAGHSYFGVGRDTQAYTTLSHLRMSAYLVCVGYWIAMLWRNAPDSRKLSENLRGQLIQLQNIVDSDLEKLRARTR
ncbi:MAG TPA: hypothetical protein VMR02_08760 [Terracidiphilus sp.]|jgi:hypothetical protein|nr:hypothetical protein [Terracidiphilus sp.]